MEQRQNGPLLLLNLLVLLPLMCLYFILNVCISLYHHLQFVYIPYYMGVHLNTKCRTKHSGIDILRYSFFLDFFLIMRQQKFQMLNHYSKCHYKGGINNLYSNIFLLYISVLCEKLRDHIASPLKTPLVVALIMEKIPVALNSGKCF